ncbi:MAP9 protein, partial [Ramphastos sulfuratus]|nr:MAP9 protein [Ramphastos sulfuratus]
PIKDRSKSSTSGFKLEDDSRKSSSVTVVTNTEHEKTKKLEMLIDENSYETLKIVEGQEVSVNDQPEYGEAMNISEDSVKEHRLVSFTINTKVLNVFLSWYFYRSLSSAPLKKKAKAVPSATPVSSQYLGTLKVLEDKCVPNSTELNKADSLRAAVFQNWLEKKRACILELKRIEKKKAENLKNDTKKKEAVKREEAIASFEAWKKQKGREAKKLSKQKKLEELEKKKAAEQNEEKTEAAQKVIHYMIISCSIFLLSRNEKKEAYTKQKKAEKVLERRKQKVQQANKEEKDKKAMEEYEKWLEKKERREQLEKRQRKLHAVHESEVPPPWSPPGKVTYSLNY